MTWIERPIGIDLGTTNSCSAMLDLDGQRLMLAEDQHGRTIVPSVVGFDPSKEEVISGFVAWNRRGLSPEPVESIKRKMGISQSVQVGPNEMSPSKVSAEILKTMQGQMREHLTRSGLHDRRLKRAVITVPAYFDAPQIEATRRAGEEAGLEVLGLLQEPTAACIYTVWKRELNDGLFLVYDLGGGTFDVSIIRALYGEYQVLGIHGDNFLGGDDFDRRLAEQFRLHLVEAGYRLDLDIQNNDDDRVRFLLLTRIAREVKEALSSTPVHYVARRDLFLDQDGKRVTLELEYSRKAWNRLNTDLIESTVRCCHEALKQAKDSAGITLADIEHVVLVGGSTRSPFVQEQIAKAFCGEGKSKAEAPTMEAPESCVALGAAIHAANLGGLRIGQDDSEILLEISGATTTRRDTVRLRGKLSGCKPEAVVLKNQRGATVGVESVEEDGAFVMEDIPLPNEGKHTMTLELLGEDGETLLTLPISFFRDVKMRRAGSALSNPTVLSKDIYLEVHRQGNLDRKILLSRGCALPFTETFELYTGDQSGAVLLTLLQNRYPISTIHMAVPKELPVGTPVLLELTVDETMSITASGNVGGQSFWAKIEAPPSRELKSWQEIEILLERAEKVSRRLWGHEAKIFQREAPFLISGIREAVQVDPDKLQVLTSRLEQLVEDFQGAIGELSPSFNRFGNLLDEIRRMVLKSDEMMGLDFDAWRARIEQIKAEGRAAFEARDQDLWTRIYTQTQALFETVFQEESRFMKSDSPEYVLYLFSIATHRSREIRARIDEFVFPKNPETRALREEALDKVSEQLQSHVELLLEALPSALENTPTTRATLQLIHQQIRQVEKQLAKIPSLGVVITHE